MQKQCYLSELHQQLEKVVKSNPTSRATVMEDEAEDPKVKITSHLFINSRYQIVSYLRSIIPNTNT